LSEEAGAVTRHLLVRQQQQREGARSLKKPGTAGNNTNAKYRSSGRDTRLNILPVKPF
jgi:hypothetical protein